MSHFRPIRARRATPLTLIVLSFLLVGCGGPKTYPVSGQVVFSDGKPATELAGGFVTFDSADALVGAQGQIQSDGTFRMGTYKPGDGAVVGHHRVVVMPRPAEDPDHPPPPVMDPRFKNPATSGLQVDVEPRPNQIVLKVERPKR